MDEVSVNNFKSTVFKALGDPSRLKILDYLRSGERCECQIVPTVGFAQPTVSRHLKVLVDCGILKRRKERNKMFYSVTSPRIFNLIDLADSRFIETLSKHVMLRIERGLKF